MRIKAHSRSQDTVCALANFNFALISFGLPLLVESHHDGSGSQTLYHPGTFDELLLTFLQGYGVDDGLSLQALQARFDDFPLGGVYHYRYARDVGVRHYQVEEGLHFFLGIEQAIIHIHVNNQGSVFHLLAGNTQGFLIILFVNQAKELTRTCHVASLAHIDEFHLSRLLQQLQARQAKSIRL